MITVNADCGGHLAWLPEERTLLMVFVAHVRNSLDNEGGGTCCTEQAVAGFCSRLMLRFGVAVMLRFGVAVVALC